MPVVERMGLTAELLYFCLLNTFFDLDSISKEEHAMVITRKEIVVLPPFSKQDWEFPFIYVGPSIDILNRALYAGLCFSDRIRLFTV